MKFVEFLWEQGMQEHTKVPPCRYSKYDLILPKKLVLTMKAFVFGNPEGVYEFYAGFGH